MHSAISRDSVAGLEFLHVGCASGELCLKALNYGAASATGIDIDADLLRKANTAAKGHPSADFVNADFEDWDGAPRSYDIVACANLLHHLYDPVAAVRKIMRLTGRRFYISVAPTAPKSMNTAGVLAVAKLLSAPVLTLGDRPASLRAADRTFTLTKSALQIIINGHSKAYESIRWSPTRRGSILEARRRQIDHLVVVAGATAVGKSTFIDRLDEPLMRARFGLDAFQYEVVKPEEIDTLRPGRHAGVIYHYDLLRPFGRPLQTHERDPAFHLLYSAERITLITLANNSDILSQRLEQRNDRRAPQWRHHRRALKTDGLAQPNFLVAWYESWLKSSGRQLSATDSCHLLLADEHYTDLRSTERLLQFVAAPASR